MDLPKKGISLTGSAGTTASARRLSILKKVHENLTPLKDRPRHGVSVASDLLSAPFNLTPSILHQPRVFPRLYALPPPRSNRNSCGGIGVGGVGANEYRLKGAKTTPAVLGTCGPIIGTGSGQLGVGGCGSNMRKLLEDLHNTRMSLEQNQKEYEKCRRKNEETDKQTSKLKVEAKELHEKWNQLSLEGASQRTELRCLEIKNRVVDETLKAAEEELSKVLEELHEVRMEGSKLSSKHLNNAVAYGMLWNGSELGRQNRLRCRTRKMEALDRYKRQLELELSDFLYMLKGVEECQKERDELEKKYNEHDKVLSKQVHELQGRIDSLDLILTGLQQEEKELIAKSEEECNKLKRDIQETQNSVMALENKGREARTTVRTQATLTKDSKGVSQKNIPKNQQGPSYENQLIEKNINSADRLVSTESKGRFKFQTPVRPKVNNAPPKSSLRKCLKDDFNNDQTEDDVICINSAVAAFGDSVRSYEPLTPTPYYDPPAKVRVVEQQVPITKFMKQLSSTKAIKRPLKGKPPASQKSQNKVIPTAKATRLPSTSGKSFQFKKKCTLSSIDEMKENQPTQHSITSYGTYQQFPKSDSSISIYDRSTPAAQLNIASSYPDEEDGLLCDDDFNFENEYV